MKKLLSVLFIPLIILGVSIAGAKYIMNSKPEPERRPSRPSTVLVEVMPLQKTDFQVWLHSRGVVEPHTQSTLIPEVSGRITWVSPKFRDGGFFEKGDNLIKIDTRDYESDIAIAEADLAKTLMELEDLKGQKINYQAALQIAESELSEAVLKLEEEKARSELALRNWEELGKQGTPGSLVLRKPQLAAARSKMVAAEGKLLQNQNELRLFDVRVKAFEAQINVAEGRLRQKEIDLARTDIIAPYAGRIREKQVDLGQYVAPGTTLADIYAIDFLEVRLPLHNTQLGMIQLPEVYRGNFSGTKSYTPGVRVLADYGDKSFTWSAKIDRTEGVVDPESQQLFVVAKIDNPFLGKNQTRPPLKIGQFVKAEIKGALLKDVFVIPQSALKTGNSLFLVDENGFVRLKKVKVIWKQDDQAVIHGEINPGDRLSLTPVIYGGTTKPFKVQVKGETKEKPKRGKS
ncbi:MAG: efflux RND transporter periplasmic adaptor subunit [Nitrospinota bacterium]